LQIGLRPRVRAWLQTNLFRRYMNYTEDSRAQVLPAHLQVAIIRYADILAAGFNSFLDMCFILLKIAVVLYFIYQENHHALPYELAMVGLAMIWGLLRYRVCKEPPESLNQMTKISDVIDDTCDKYRMIANYGRRMLRNDIFEKAVVNLRHMEHPEESYELHTGYFYKWLGPLFIGIYIHAVAEAVVLDRMELGILLSTIVSIKEITEGLCEANEIFEQAHRGVSALRTFTYLLNLETDVLMQSEVHQRRRTTMRQARKEVNKVSDKSDPIDMLPIKLLDVGFTFNAKLSRSSSGFEQESVQKPVLDGLCLDVQQGRMVAVTAQHMAGKQTLLRLLGGELFPNSRRGEAVGEIFVPAHLRLLHVSQEAYMVKGSLWDNLVFGVEWNEDKDPKRVAEVLKKLDLWDTLSPFFKVPANCQGIRAPTLGDTFVTDAEEEEAEPATSSFGCCLGCASPKSHVAPAAADDDSSAWQDQLTYSMKMKLHLARALISSAEVLVLQRPLHHYSKEGGMAVLKVLREHVVNRGLGFSPRARHKRRPRTVFFTAEAVEHILQSDICWEIRGTQVDVTDLSTLTKDENGRAILVAHFSRTHFFTQGMRAAASEHEERTSNRKPGSP